MAGYERSVVPGVSLIQNVQSQREMQLLHLTVQTVILNTSRRLNNGIKQGDCQVKIKRGSWFFHRQLERVHWCSAN